MSARSVLLFDLGGVLMETIGRDILPDLLTEPMPRDAIMPRWLASPSVKRFESGATDADAFAREFIAEWRLALAPDAFLESFAGWVTGFYEGAPALLERLRARYTVACLSNTNGLHMARFPEIERQFDRAFFSHRLRVMKPERAAFTRTLEALGVAADRVWFFDDMAENVAAARAAGLHAVQVEGFAAIGPALRAAGLD